MRDTDDRSRLRRRRRARHLALTDVRLGDCVPGHLVSVGAIGGSPRWSCVGPLLSATSALLQPLVGLAMTYGWRGPAAYRAWFVVPEIQYWRGVVDAGGSQAALDVLRSRRWEHERRPEASADE